MTSEVPGSSGSDGAPPANSGGRATPLRRHAPTVAGNQASPRHVASMFDQLASRYDAMNAVISGFQEPRWRRRAVALAGLHTGMSAIDVATGTGKVAAGLADAVGREGRVVGVDLSPGMIERAIASHGTRPELEFVVADALALPAADGTFDAATIAFGMRNLADYGRGFEEMLRVLRPGGRLVCLEIARPHSPVGRAGRIWFERIVPLLGALVGRREAYAYLVRSVRAYPSPEAIARIMRDAGLVEVSWMPLTFGMVTIHVGRRPTA